MRRDTEYYDFYSFDKIRQKQPRTALFWHHQTVFAIAMKWRGLISLPYHGSRTNPEKNTSTEPLHFDYNHTRTFQHWIRPRITAGDVFFSLENGANQKIWKAQFCFDQIAPTAASSSIPGTISENNQTAPEKCYLPQRVLEARVEEHSLVALALVVENFYLTSFFCTVHRMCAEKIPLDRSLVFKKLAVTENVHLEFRSIGSFWDKSNKDIELGTTSLHSH